jgi:hypothetical protein
MLPCSGANRKENLTLARKSRSENGGACPGEVDTGSPSGHATKRRETWLFDNLDLDERDMRAL